MLGDYRHMMLLQRSPGQLRRSGLQLLSLKLQLVQVTIRVFLNGPRLLQALLDTRFTSLAREFNPQNGQLQLSTFQIINVNGNGESGVALCVRISALKSYCMMLCMVLCVTLCMT